MFYAQIFRQQQYRENDKMTKWWGKNVRKCIFPLNFFFLFDIMSISCISKLHTSVFLKFSIYQIATYQKKKWKLIEYISDELEHISEVQTTHIFLTIFFLGQTIAGQTEYFTLTSVTQTSFKINNYKKKKWNQEIVAMSKILLNEDLVPKLWLLLKSTS